MGQACICTVKFDISEKYIEVGTPIVLCHLIRIIPYYLVHVLCGTAIPTSFIGLFNFFVVFLLWYNVKLVLTMFVEIYPLKSR